jgi:hypothetical protein
VVGVAGARTDLQPLPGAGVAVVIVLAVALVALWFVVRARARGRRREFSADVLSAVIGREPHYPRRWRVGNRPWL